MYNNILYHHGILGQRWGVRRFQNEDGSLTSAGRQRYGVTDRKNDTKMFGTGGQKRIERDVSEGMTKKKARRKELTREIITGAAVTAGIAFISGDISSGGQLHRYIGSQMLKGVSKAGRAFVNSQRKRRMAKSIVKIAKNSYFDPIDTVGRFV